MADYSKGIIYTIRSKDNIYVGSTLNLRSRKNQHKYCIYKENLKTYNLKLYKTIRENDGEWDMQPYSKYPCNSKLELTIEEERVRQHLKADLNGKSCGSELTKKEYMKQYNERLDDQKKDKVREKKKQWYEQNKDKINEQKRQKITCECGCVVLKRCLTQHRKRPKHLKLIQSLEV